MKAWQCRGCGVAVLDTTGNVDGPFAAHTDCPVCADRDWRDIEVHALPAHDAGKTFIFATLRLEPPKEPT